MQVPDGTPQSFVRVPVNRYLRLRLVSQESDQAVVEMDVSPDQIQETGVVHGGLLSAAADTAAVYAVYPDPHGRVMTSIEFKVNFLRPATVDRGAVTARSKVLRRGRKIAVCEVEVSQTDRLVAKGTFTYLFLEP